MYVWMHVCMYVLLLIVLTKYPTKSEERRLYVSSWFGVIQLIVCNNIRSMKCSSSVFSQETKNNESGCSHGFLSYHIFIQPTITVKRLYFHMQHKSSALS